MEKTYNYTLIGYNDHKLINFHSDLTKEEADKTLESWKTNPSHQRIDVEEIDMSKGQPGLCHSRVVWERNVKWQWHKSYYFVGEDE